MKNEKRGEVTRRYEGFIACEVTADLSLRMARDMADGGEMIHEADVVAAQRYLLRCLHNMGSRELQMMTPELAAALWARGALGASRYRSAKGRRK